MIWRLLLVVFIVTSSIAHSYGQNFTPIGITSSAVTNNTIYGYCFQANTSFTICGLKVKYNSVTTPTNQRLFVVKFSTMPANYAVTPPLTPSTQIFPFTVTSPTAAQLCNITVNSGEYIGIYGYRESACTNYFSTLSAGTLTVNGFNMSLTRSGGVLTNGTCGTTPSFTGFFSEPGLPLGAIELYTNCCFIPTIGTITQPNCSSTTGSIILNGLPPGNWTLNCYANGNITTPSSTITGSGNSYTVSGLTAGSYIFSVTNSGGCTSGNTSSTTINPSITIPTASITNNTGNTLLTCAQNSISLSASGNGTYSWTNGSTVVGTGSTLAATAPGTYTLTVTASNGCTATSTLALTQDISTPGSSISSPYNQLNCTLTSFTLTASGNGTYSWSNGTTNLGTNSSISVSSAGTYQLTVTGANGCTSTSNYTVTQFTGTNVSVNSTSICSGQNSTLTATPGISGGAYSWSPGGATTNSITVNPNTTTSYTVNYTISGCSTTGSGTITVSPTPIVSVNNATICPGVNTILTASGSPSGGTYSWSPSGQTGATLTVNPTSTTNYTVTYNLNGCTPGTANSIVTVQNSLDFVNVQSPGSTTICQGQTQTIYGQVYEAGLTNPVGQAAGITAEFAYNTANTDPSTWPAASWNAATYNPLSLLNPNNDEYMGVIPALSPGTYYYAFRFTFNGCVSYGGYSSTGGGFWNGSVNINGTLIVNPILSPSFNPISAICAGSALNALPTTSTNLITGTWSPVLNNQQTTTYSFAPTAGLCASATTLTITVNPLPTASITSSPSSALTCATTSITLTASGGMSYLWSTANTTSSIAVTTPGTFSVLVTGANGCTATATQTVTQNITPPPAAITAPTTSVLTCATTSISLTATGGGTYSWSNGTTVLGTNATLAVTTPGTYTVTVTGSNGCSATAAQVITQNNSAPTASITPPTTSVLTCTTTSISLTGNGTGNVAWTNPAPISVNPTISVTTPGVYTLTITAANGCTGTASQTITQNTTAPAAAISALTTSVLTCTTTSITLTATGGGTYSWSNGTTVVGTNATLAVTSPGTYTVTVTGTNGCTATAAQTITQNITAPTAGINAPTTTVLSCTTANIALTATGGGSYSWSNGTNVVGTTPTLTVTSPGTYTVTVTAANGCTATANQVITQDIVTPVASITNNTNSTILDCNTTQISLTGNGGTTASWSNGTTTVSNTAALTVTTAGTYTYTGTNANGCFDTETITITYTANTNPTFNQIAAICTNGTFTLPTTSTNGVQGTWSPAPNYTTTTTYTFQPNAGLCANTAAMTITVHPYPVVTIQNDTVCAGGSATITANVDLAGGTYTWSPVVSATNAITVTPNATANYQVIYSLLGCADTSTAEIFVNPIPTVSLINYTICNGQSVTIQPSINLIGGSFVWSNGSTLDSLVISPNTNSTYTLSYTLNGCTSPTASSSVTVNPVPTLGINNSTICFGDNTTVTAVTNLPGGTFYWGTPGVAGAASQTITPINDTTITVFYTLNGCSSPTVTSTVTVKPLPIATFSSNVTQGCVPLQVNFIPDDATNTDYTWTTSNSLSSTNISPNLNFQTSGSFDVTLTTSLNGCVVTETLTNYIQVDDYPIADFGSSVIIFSEQNQPVQFENNSIGASSYIWEFGDGGTSTVDAPSHIFLNTEDGEIIVLTAISLHGCTDTAMLEIPFDPGLIFYIPNSFTPDGDMNNQTFTPVISSGIDIYHYTLYIYNRWGELIFESNDTSIGWDGSYGPSGIHCQSGTYTYQIVVKLPNIDQRKSYTGTVNLIR